MLFVGLCYLSHFKMNQDVIHDNVTGLLFLFLKGKSVVLEKIKEKLFHLSMRMYNNRMLQNTCVIPHCLRLRATLLTLIDNCFALDVV